MMALAASSCIPLLVSGSNAQRTAGDARKNITAVNNADLRMIRSLVELIIPLLDLAESGKKLGYN
jgi:hypothetical protein